MYRTQSRRSLNLATLRSIASSRLASRKTPRIRTRGALVAPQSRWPATHRGPQDPGARGSPHRSHGPGLPQSGCPSLSREQAPSRVLQHRQVVSPPCNAMPPSPGAMKEAPYTGWSKTLPRRAKMWSAWLNNSAHRFKLHPWYRTAHGNLRWRYCFV